MCSGGIANLSRFVGGMSPADTLVGPNQANVWTFRRQRRQIERDALFELREPHRRRAGRRLRVCQRDRRLGSDRRWRRNRLDYSAYVTPVTVDLSPGTATNTAGVADIQDVTGGTLGDTLTGNSQDNVFLGGGGNDTLTGNEGRDLLFGGDGLDTILGRVGRRSDCQRKDNVRHQLDGARRAPHLLDGRAQLRRSHATARRRRNRRSRCCRNSTRRPLPTTTSSTTSWVMTTPIGSSPRRQTLERTCTI